MKFCLLAAVVAATLAGNVVTSQELTDPFVVAAESGACGIFPVLTAVYTLEGTIEVTCGTDEQPFLDQQAGFALGGLAVVGLIAAAAGGDSGPSDTD